MGKVTPLRVSTSRPSSIRICDSSKVIASATLVRGMAKTRPTIRTRSALTIARVTGRVMVSLVPISGSLWTSMTPPSFEMFVLTTSMPTPRPL